MPVVQSTLFSFLLASAGAKAATILVSHFQGDVSTLSLESTGNNGNYSLSVSATATDCGQLPSWLTLDSDSGTLYCTDASWNDDSTVSALSLGPDGSVADSVQTRAMGGSVHNGLYAGADGAQYLASAHYGNSAVTTYALPLEESSEILQTLEFTMSGPGAVPDRQDAPHPHQVLADPSGSVLLSADLGADLIRVFAIDPATGNLEDCPAINTTAGAGPRHVRFANANGNATAPAIKGRAAKDTKFYVTNELSNDVSVYSASYTKSGCLSAEEVQSINPFPGDKPGPEGSALAEVEIHGNTLYASNRGDASFGSDDSIARFTIEDDGLLTFEEITTSYGVYPRSFVINKAGDLVAIGNQVSSNVAVVERDVATGKLGKKVADLQLGSKGEPGKEEGISGIVWNE